MLVLPVFNRCRSMTILNQTDGPSLGGSGNPPPGGYAISPALVVSWLAAMTALGWAVAVSVTGGFVFTAAGVRISSHRIVPAYLLAVVLLVASRHGRAAARRLSAMRCSPLAATGIAGCLALVVLAFGIAFGTFTAVGDAFGYIAQSTLWLKGQLFQPAGPVLAMMWPDAGFALCPLGFRPGVIAGTMVPVYAPGLPLLMAMLRAVLGETGPYLVVPLSGAATVYLVFRLGRIWRDDATAVLAAGLVAASPVFLFQLMQPMSDVPVTAWWLLAIVAACAGSSTGAVGAGLAASVAILIRPNLAPLVVPLATWVVAAARGGLRTRVWRLLLFAVAVAPLCLLVAWVQATFYGSPVASGYGRASDIYAARNLVTNLRRYPAWLSQTHTPFLLLALIAPFLVARTGGRRCSESRFAWLALAFAACVLLCYLFYIPFDHWSFLRFLLPALPLLILLSTGSLVSLLHRWQTWGRFAIACSVGALVLLYVQAAVRGDVFRLGRMFRDNYRSVGTTIAERSPRNAVFIAVVQTSSVSYYGHRQTVRYDLVPPAQFDRAIADLRHAGYRPYLLLVAEEERDFRARFSGRSPVGNLRCSPLQAFARGAARLYDVKDCETGTRK